MRPLAWLILSCVLPSTALADDASQRPPPPPPNGPVERYRELSVSLTSGIDFVGTAGGPGGWAGFYVPSGANVVSVVGLGAAARVVVRGVVIGAEMSVTFFDGVPGASAALFPGATLGYAISLTRRLALTPAFHAELGIPTGKGASVIALLTGELALQVFLGDHGFIEPVIALGDLQTSAPAFAFGVGYRLGVVF
jgi:hypothetical protein